MMFSINIFFTCAGLARSISYMISSEMAVAVNESKQQKPNCKKAFHCIFMAHVQI